jgi:hypothetical protein
MGPNAPEEILARKGYIDKPMERNRPASTVKELSLVIS